MTMIPDSPLRTTEPRARVAPALAVQVGHSLAERHAAHERDRAAHDGWRDQRAHLLLLDPELDEANE